MTVRVAASGRRCLLQGRVTSQLAPLLSDLEVELRGLEDANRHDRDAKPLAGVKQPTMHRIWEPAAGVPHLRPWVARLSDVDKYHGKRERHIKRNSDGQEVGRIPTLPMGQVALPLLAPPPAILCDVRHHDPSNRKLNRVKGLVQLLVDLGPCELHEPADKDRPTSGAHQ
eukprot:CAMPEP_0197904422 /NCGR_PEP_ID=MMETSP1439-20131203/58026_1 /TAXON_ID=66791 /ORGANISM="Gonyaulax spinifera, Strain CCMP409" /LENGTH=169 /DNA_ID=CAMNT_0043525615 /DNA_START=229 /DNA_END=739 /DNA_ORIENTATION=+